MIWLFLIAFFLAWPTYGISLLVFVGFAILNAIGTAKARMHYANEARAAKDTFVRDDASKPSWAAMPSRIHEFFRQVRVEVVDEGVPEAYARHFTGDAIRRDALLHWAARMERQGSTFIEQIISTADQICGYWKRLPAEERQAFLISK